MKNSKESGDQLRAKPATRRRRLDKVEPVEKKSGWMEENRERLAAALESLGDGIVVTQTDGTICYVNPAFERLTGFATEEIVGKNGSVFVTNGNFRKLQGLIRETLQRNTIWTGSVAIGKKDGSSFKAEVSIVPRWGSFDKRRICDGRAGCNRTKANGRGIAGADETPGSDGRDFHGLRCPFATGH